MKKTQILAFILGGLLTVQNISALAASSSNSYFPNGAYISRLYAKTAGASGSSGSVITKETARTTEEKIKDLQNLGIIDQTSDLRLNDKISRAEIAKILTAMNNSTAAAAEIIRQGIFTDVPAFHWASGYIEFAYANGIIEGDQELFRPEDNVTFAEMCKMLICTLGYNVYAEAQGGYPHGYISRAEALGITEGTDGIGTYDELTREQTMIMAYNALDVPIVVVDGWESVSTLDGIITTPVLAILDGNNGKDFCTLRIYRFSEDE